VLHAATPDPLAELAAMEPGEVVLVGRIASPPEKSGFGYMADLRVERLWYEGREVVRGGGVEVFAGDLSLGVGDRVVVAGEISRPQIGEDGFDYSRYLAKKSLVAFNARLHEETDLDALSESLVGVAGIMQCKHISLYLRPETSSKEARTEQRPLIHPSA
jgi:hypothetical protein